MTEFANEIPVELRAGDTLKWTRTLPAYPASDGWALSYSLVGRTGAHTFSGTADGDGFAVTVSATTSANFTAGRYRLTEYVTKGTERFTTATKDVTVLANLAGATTAADTRSHAQKMLDAIEAYLESKAPTAASVEIAGRKISNYPLTDLLALRSKYQNEVAIEARLASGLGGLGVVYARFR